MRHVFIALGVVLIGCSNPDSTDEIECGPNGTCPAGYECNKSTNKCVRGGGDAGFPDAKVAPKTTILTKPAMLTNVAAATFTFSADIASATFECKVDTGNFAACTTPFMTTVTDGAHTFTVRASAGGVVDPNPPSAMWTLDTMPPTVMITAGPSGDVAISDAAFMFTASETGSTFSCKLDTGAAAACTSGKSYPVGPGAHTFTVTATDPAGNTSAPATRSFNVSCTPPQTNLTKQPDSVTRSTTATFEFNSPTTGATFECSRNGGAFSACASPQNLTGLAEGTYMFDVRAVVASAPEACRTDPTPAHATWTVNLTQPIAIIDSGAENGIASTTVKFTYHSDPAGATFECAIDGNFVSCPASGQTYTNLVPGKSYTFQVRAIALGTTGPPASRAFVVAGGPITVTSPAGLTGPKDVLLTFMPVFEGLVYTCVLDDKDLGVCASGMTLPLLKDGAHKITVNGAVTAGGAVVSTGSSSFTTDATPPTVTISSPGPIVGPDGSINYMVTDANGATFTCTITNGGTTHDVVNCSSTNTFSLAGLAGGPTTFTIIAKDSLGNTTTKSVSFEIDAVGPEFDIEDPFVPEAGGFDRVCSSGTIDFRIDTTPSQEDPDTDDVISITCTLTTVNGAFVSSGPCDPSTGFVFTDLDTGTYILSISGKDKYGNKTANPDDITFFVDGTGPTVTISTPPNYLPAPDNLTSSCGIDCPVSPTTTGVISYSVVDDPAPTEPATCEIDGQPCATSCGVILKNPQVVQPSFEFCELADGAHEVVITAVDPCGNIGTGSSGWTVDAVGPVIDTLTTTSLGNGAATVTYTAHDAASSIKEFVCTIDGEPIACPIVQTTFAHATGTVSFAVGELSPGPHVFSIFGRDVWLNDGATRSNAPGDFIVTYSGAVGHAVLIGFDFAAPTPNGAIVLQNAVKLAAVRGTANGRAIRALAYFPGVTPNGPMAMADHDNAKAAIEALGGDVVLTEFGPGVNGGGTAADLAVRLRNKDVFVVYDLQSSAGIDNLRAMWQPTMTDFVTRGGTVVVMDGLTGAVVSNTWRLLLDAGMNPGLMPELDQVSTLPPVFGKTPAVALPVVRAHCDPDDHPLRAGAAAFFTPPTNTVAYLLNNADLPPSVVPIYVDDTDTGYVVLDKVLPRPAAPGPARMKLISIPEAESPKFHTVAYYAANGDLTASCRTFADASTIHNVDADAFMTALQGASTVQQQRYAAQTTYVGVQPYDSVKVPLSSLNSFVVFPQGQDHGNITVVLPSEGLANAKYYRVTDGCGYRFGDFSERCGDRVSEDCAGKVCDDTLLLNWVCDDTVDVIAEALDDQLNVLAYAVATDITPVVPPTGGQAVATVIFSASDWKTDVIPLGITNVPAGKALRASALVRRNGRTYVETPAQVCDAEGGQLSITATGQIIHDPTVATENFSFFTSAAFSSQAMSQILEDNNAVSRRDTDTGISNAAIDLRYDTTILPLVYNPAVTPTDKSESAAFTQLEIGFMPDGGSSRLDDVGGTGRFTWSDFENLGACDANGACAVGSCSFGTCVLKHNHTWTVILPGAATSFTLPQVPEADLSEYSPRANSCIDATMEFDESNRIHTYFAFKAAYPSYGDVSFDFPYTVLTSDPGSFISDQAVCQPVE